MTVKNPCPACGALVEREIEDGLDESAIPADPYCDTPMCVAQRNLSKKKQTVRIADTLTTAPNNIADSRARQQHPEIVLLDARDKPIVQHLDDDGNEIPSPQPYKTPFTIELRGTLASIGDSPRCDEHGKPAPCYVCENERNRAEADAFIQKIIAEKGECRDHPGYIAGDCYPCRRKADEARADAELKKRVEKPAASLEELIRNVTNYLDLNKKPADERDVDMSRRRFYQPLPEGNPINWEGLSIPWNAGAGGMTPRNIAMFLTMPEFIYTDYEKNKNNPPKWVYKTADESFNRRLYKLSPFARNTHSPFARGIHDQQQDEVDTLAPVGAEIKQRAEAIVIRVAGEPARQVWRKKPPPTGLIDALKQAKDALKLLTAKWNKERGGLTPDQLKSARVRRRREIVRFEEQIAEYNHVQLIDDPESGTPTWNITIPPCPEGCTEVFSPLIIREYVTKAFNTLDYTNWSEWQYAQLENQIIDRLYMKNFVRSWMPPRSSSGSPPLNGVARARWVLDGCPRPADAAFKDFYARDRFSTFYESDNSWRGSAAPDSTTSEAAERGYRYGVDGRTDSSIRRVGPHGHGPDSEKD